MDFYFIPLLVVIIIKKKGNLTVGKLKVFYDCKTKKKIPNNFTPLIFE